MLSNSKLQTVSY